MVSHLTAHIWRLAAERLDDIAKLASMSERRAYNNHEAAAIIRDAASELRRDVRTVSPALEDIAAERRRQIEVEGCSAEDDDEHTIGEMAQAAGVYAIGTALPRERSRVMNRYWPWDGSWFKPGDARRDLIKAGALIVAEIERLDRAAERAKAA